MLTQRRHLLASTIIAGLAVSAALPAMAQTAQPAQAPATEVEAVVVTGSRIKRNEFNSPDPVQVVTAEQGRLQGIGSTGALLQSATIASGSPQVNAAISSAFITDGGPGAETISLRGLGAVS